MFQTIRKHLQCSIHGALSGEGMIMTRKPVLNDKAFDLEARCVNGSYDVIFERLHDLVFIEHDLIYDPIRMCENTVIKAFANIEQRSIKRVPKGVYIVPKLLSCEL